eukprot:Anaeramoba_ignava/c17350_g1_i2.p1 GENE.c17350_g1_i2~~c17350_g1_i2.p1  ORF type:complete len:267 (+),score=86.01 c17350_g1_i2:86-802(+)
MGGIVLAPTRELAYQIHQVAEFLFKYHNFKCCLIIGGFSRQKQTEILEKGTNLIIGTPGRLLDHLQQTKGFNYQELKILVFDEADRMLEIGFSETISKILKILPKKRQTILFSATLSPSIKDLIRLSFQSQPIYINVDQNSEISTVKELQQGFIQCFEEERFLILFMLLHSFRKNHKVIVYFSTIKSVKFHKELLSELNMVVYTLYGKQKQEERQNTFENFCKTNSGILLSTNVAARG